MPRYLNPKIDMVFKRIFCEHLHILMGFLNTTLPLLKDHKIIELNYLRPE